MRPTVLFIEDEDKTLYAIGRLLESEGFVVDQARDGEVGLELGQSGRHDVILLDLVLPKRNGLDVLRNLRGANIWTPVVILTGHGDAGSAFEAGRLRATAFLSKAAPLSELVMTLKNAAAEQSEVARSGEAALFARHSSRESTSLSTLLLNLGARIPLDQNLLARQIADVICAEDVTFPQFLAVAQALRSLQSNPGTGLWRPVPRIRAWIINASRPSFGLGHGQLEHVVAHFVAAGHAWSRESEQTIADALGVDSRALWRTLNDECGVTFIRCRLAVPMRRAAIELRTGNDHVRQIAFRLGYKDAARFDRHFKDFFGVTPSAFRRL